MHKRVFISYSHDTEEHKEWVKDLASYLRENGVDIVFDQWGLNFGDDLPSFMEQSIKETDRVLIICTDKYIEKANSGIGGVGYEKTIVTAEMLSNVENRRKFIPIVRNVTKDEKLPTFFGAAYYLDLSDGEDDDIKKQDLIKRIYNISLSKPKLGPPPYIATEKPPSSTNPQEKKEDLPYLRGEDQSVIFSDRFSQAFPGLRGTEWFDDPEKILERLTILFRQPIVYQDGCLMYWWRGSSNLHIQKFDHIEGAHYLMNVDELNIKRIAACNEGSYYQKFVYIETNPNRPTELYELTADDITRNINLFGYYYEEYGLVDGSLPINRAEYDDGATIIEGKPVDVLGRVELRVRYVTPYNFIISPQSSPINNQNFDSILEDYLNRMLQGEDVFDAMSKEILQLPKRNL